jgi:hypothetical protein
VDIPNVDNIQGMLLILNKLYWKLPAIYTNSILTEAADLPNFNGSFKFDKKIEEVIFISNKV